MLYWLPPYNKVNQPCVYICIYIYIYIYIYMYFIPLEPPTPVFLGFPCGSSGKEPACNACNLGLIPGLGRSPGEGKGYPLQYSGLENPMDSIIHAVAKSQTLLNNFLFHFSRASFPAAPSDPFRSHRAQG